MVLAPDPLADVPPGGPWPVLAPPALGDGSPAPAAPGTFSVVVAAYQAEASIVDALASALDQTHPPLEVVVCDDGSTDATAALAEGVDPRVRVLRQPNRGESAAKNAAVAAALGDYVVVLDADDLFHPRRLEALAWLAARRPDLDVLTTDAVLETDGVPVRQAYHPGWPFPADDQRAAILDHNFVFGLCAVRRERWLAAGGFDESFARAADWEFWLRLVLDGSRVGLVDRPLARYRLTAGTLSSGRVPLVEARLEVLRRAAARPDLTAAERAVVRRATRRERQDLRVRRLDQALRQGVHGTRRRALAVLLAGATPPRARAGAALATLLPGLAGRRRHDRDDGTVEIGAGLRATPAPASGRRPPDA